MSPLRVPESILYKRVDDELVVMQLETGRYYYFTPGTEALLEHFRRPRTVPAPHGELCRFLLAEGILKEVPEADDTPGEDFDPRESAAFLRRGETTIDELVFLCP